MSIGYHVNQDTSTQTHTWVVVLFFTLQKKKKPRSIHMLNLNRQLVKNQLIKTLKPLILFHFK